MCRAICRNIGWQSTTQIRFPKEKHLTRKNRKTCFPVWTDHHYRSTQAADGGAKAIARAVGGAKAASVTDRSQREVPEEDNRRATKAQWSSIRSTWLRGIAQNPKIQLIL